MLTYVKNEERTLSFGLLRGYNNSASRGDRYIPIEKKNNNVTQHRIINEFFNHFVKGREVDPDTKKYFTDAYKSESETEAAKGLIALYNDQYVMSFIGVENLCTCGLKITHSEEEKEIFRAFMSGSSTVAFKCFQQLCLKLLREKQRIRILKGLPIVGILYSNYPEEDIEVSKGFMRYMNRVKAFEIADKVSIEVISDALERGCTLEEIDDVLPNDPEVRFMSRKMDDVEISQIEFLQPKSAVNA